MGVDPKLLTLAMAAEAGEACPPVFLATASHIVNGLPVGHQAFMRAADKPVQRLLWEGIVKGDTPRKQREETFQGRLRALQPVWDRVDDAEPGDPIEALTVAPAIVWGWGEDSGLRVPSVRVPLDQVTSWWLGAGEQVKGDSGWSWFFGVSVPLDTYPGPRTARQRASSPRDSQQAVLG